MGKSRNPRGKLEFQSVMSTNLKERFLNENLGCHCNWLHQRFNNKQKTNKKMEKEKQNKTTRNFLLVIGAIFALTIVGIIIFSGPNANSNTIREDNLDTISLATLIDDDSVKGSPDAPVTIIEFSDYECSFCQRFYEGTYQQIKENYIDTGKVNLVYRDFPLNFHQNAQKAAEAAECAGEQEMYYEMHDKLFGEGVEGGTDTFKKYAQEIGLDQEQFDACLDSGAMRNEVKNDLEDGQKLGISGTPSFIINGELVVGAQPYSVLSEKIDNALNE